MWFKFALEAVKRLGKSFPGRFSKSPYKVPRRNSTFFAAAGANAWPKKLNFFA
jgi:hypothetical protein